MALLVILAAAWQWNRPEVLARRYQEQLADLTDTEIEAQLQRIAQLGDAGLPVLAAALGSERESIRANARTLLIEEVGHWELLPSERATAKLAILAAGLVKSSSQFSTGQFDARDRGFAADLALRIMHWPQDGGGDARPSSLLANCERVLAHCAAPHAAPLAGAQNRTDRDTPQSAANAVTDSRSARSQRDAAIRDVDLDSLPALARLPGGGLPLDLANLPPPIEIGRSRANVGEKLAEVEPPRLPERIAGQPLDEETKPADLQDQTPAANQPRRLPNEDAAAGNTRLLHGEIDEGKAAELLRAGDEGLAAWKRLELRAVMRELHASDPDLAIAAQAELVRRGITGPLMELARQAADPNPTVRQQCAASLPTLPGVDARPWLLELSYDEDPKVRGTAVTLMATSGDLELLKRVQQVSLDDPDDDTRAQAEKALRVARSH